MRLIIGLEHLLGATDLETATFEELWIAEHLCLVLIAWYAHEFGLISDTWNDFKDHLEKARVRRFQSADDRERV